MARPFAPRGLAATEQTLAVRPLNEQLVKVSVAAELLQEDVDLQRFKLWPTQVGIGPKIRVVEVEYLLGQLLVALPYPTAVFSVELEQSMEEGELMPDGFLRLSHA